MDNIIFLNMEVKLKIWCSYSLYFFITVKYMIKYDYSINASLLPYFSCFNK